MRQSGGRRPPAPARLVLVLTGFLVACQAASSPAPSISPAASPVAGATGSPIGSATPAPATTIASREGRCAMRVSESFMLANDMTCQGDGMVIDVDNVTVDLGGHTLTGPGMGPQTWPLPQLDSVGVRGGGPTGGTIRNGKTIGFSTRISFLEIEARPLDNGNEQRDRFWS